MVGPQNNPYGYDPLNRASIADNRARLTAQAAAKGEQWAPPFAQGMLGRSRDAGAPSLAGVTDFDTWAAVQRDPMYQRNEERFAQVGTGYGPNGSAPGAGGYQTLQDTFGALRNDMSLQDFQAQQAQKPAPFKFNGQGYTPGAERQAARQDARQAWRQGLPQNTIDEPTGGKRPPSTEHVQPWGGIRPPSGAYGDYDPHLYGGGGGGKRPGWVGNVGGPQDGRPVMGNFTAGRRRKPRARSAMADLRFGNYLQSQLGGR